jgi:hypothetical protein
MEEKRLKAEYLAAQKDMATFAKTQKDLRNGYFAQAQYWQSEIGRCRQFISHEEVRLACSPRPWPTRH